MMRQKLDSDLIENYLKGANTDFAAYDLETLSKTLTTNLLISHADHDWDSKLQEK